MSGDDMADPPAPSNLPAFGQSFSLAPKTLAEAMEFSQLIADSGICPAAFKGKPGDVLVAVQMGAELGVAPLQALANIAVINGRACIWGDLMLAVVQRSGLLVTIQERDGSAALKAGAGKCRVVRRGDPTEHVAEFSLEDAKRAGLATKAGPWTTNPGRMLQMRARAFALRDKFADVLKGLSSREEVEDYDVTPTSVPGTDILTPRAKSVARPQAVAPAPMEAEPETAPAEDPPDAHIVEGVEERTGNGKLFYVVSLSDPSGASYSATTFSETLAATARAAIGSAVVIETKTTEKGGKTYVNLIGMTVVGAREPGMEG